MERALGHDELPLGVETWYEVGVDVVAAVLVVARLQLHPAVVVRQDVGEPAQKYLSVEVKNIFNENVKCIVPVLGPIDGEVRGGAGLVPAHVLELLELLAKPEVAVRGHDAVVLGEVLALHRPGCFDHRIRKAHLK